MAYINNKFCWHGIISTDPGKAEAFYSQVLPWSVRKQQMGEDTATFFAAADVNRAHVMKPPMEGVPSHWDNYLRVEDVNAATAAALENGGTQLVPPTDIPPGRFSVVTSPSGAAISLFHEADETAQNAPAADGGIHWVELHSKDIEADLAWLKSSFGITTEIMDMEMGPYHILKSGEETVGGAITGMNEQAPSMWLTWIQVSNVDDTISAVNTHGGQVHGDLMEVPGVGRMAVVADPTGGVFGVITPAA